jgi:hypothetical protein
VARVKHIIAAQMRTTPGKSIWRNFSFGVAGVGAAAFGGWKANHIANAAHPPNGKLM